MDIFFQANDEPPNKETLLNEIASLLKKIVSEYRSQSEAFRYINEKTGYSESSLKRAIQGKSLTHARTSLDLAKLAYPLDADDDLKVLDKVKKDYPGVAWHIANGVESIWFSSQQREAKGEIDRFIQNDPIYRSIYILVAGGGSTISEIKEEFGQNGLRTLELMLNQRVLEMKGDIVKIGTVSPSINLATSVVISRDILNKHLQEESLREYKKNYLRYILYPTSEETFIELLRVDEEANRKKMNILKSSKIPDDPSKIVRYASVTHADSLGTISVELRSEEVQ